MQVLVGGPRSNTLIDGLIISFVELELNGRLCRKHKDHHTS